MSKHTPGQWWVGRCIASNAPMIVDRGHGKAFDAMIESQDVMVCDVGGRTRQECLANTRLIAAAPELLSALVELEKVESSPHSETVRYLAREKARAAIAKARGEA